MKTQLFLSKFLQEKQEEKEKHITFKIFPWKQTAAIIIFVNGYVYKPSGFTYPPIRSPCGYESPILSLLPPPFNHPGHCEFFDKRPFFHFFTIYFLVFPLYFPRRKKASCLHNIRRKWKMNTLITFTRR